jgi:hypothetical protein
MAAMDAIGRKQPACLEAPGRPSGYLLLQHLLAAFHPKRSLEAARYNQCGTRGPLMGTAAELPYDRDGVKTGTIGEQPETVTLTSSVQAVACTAR